MNNSKKGKLFVVATPIGNLKDITLRALEVLKNVEFIATEDTRRTLKLLNNFDIKNKKLIAVFKGQEKKRSEKIISILKKGEDVALVSEGGTPGISDPGAYLVRRCHIENIKVVPVPGPSAPVSALSVSGMDGDKFLFIGFLPKSRTKKRKILELLKFEENTVIIFISPHTLIKDLMLLREFLEKDRQVFLIREMTKLFEEYKRGNIEEIIKWTKNKKGEFTLIIEGKWKK